MLRYSTGTCLEKLRKITENLNENSRSLGRESNPGPPKKISNVKLTKIFSITLYEFQVESYNIKKKSFTLNINTDRIKSYKFNYLSK
jgi:hypothetical protein